MKILQISSARTFGGGERHFVDLVKTLSARGQEVSVAISPRSPLREKLAPLPEANIYTLPLRNAFDLNSATLLARLIRQYDIEIVHAHLARDYPLAAYAVHRAKNARLVITRHVPFALNRLHRFALANVARVIAVSEGVARGLRAQGIFADEKIRVVPNGISVAQLDAALLDLDRAEVRRAHSINTPLLVGTIGELSAVKGQEDYVRAAALIIGREKFEDAQFLIIGDDRSRDRRTRTRLEELIAAHGLQKHVRLSGYVSDLTPLIAAFDLYVSASRAEAFGLATLEAMMCGVAPVATATDGAREIIEDDVTGKLVPVGDVEALARAILQLLRDERARMRMGAHARSESRMRFDLERMVDETGMIYRETLAVK